jgi:molybdate transport system substrate-binding protein
VKKLIAIIGAGLLIATTAACGSNDSSDTTITVYAAASLTDTFTAIGQEFETANPGVRVRFNFGGSSNLVAQIQQGAPADVFASANPENMTAATADDLTATAPVDFATNTLQIATPPDNPAGITTLADLARNDVTVVLCAPAVPCGAAAVQIEQTSGVAIDPVSEEQSVTDVLNKVITGEADAGLVYVTDVDSAGDSVLGIEFPETSSVVNRYPIAPLAGSDHAATAQAFADFVAGPAGQRILQAAGFGAP